MENLPNILYVDDEEINLRIFINAFRKYYNIFTAISGREGLEILEKQQVDLIITDQRMPEMTGVEFLEIVIVKHPEPNRILLTAYSDFNAVTNAINVGKIFQFVPKPWKKDELKPILDKAIEIYLLKKYNSKLLLDIKNELNEKKIILAKLEKALQKANESEELKSAFLRNISHEIRTPMNAILGFSEMLKNEFKNIDNEFVKIIQENIEILLVQIENIIELSKLQTEKSNIDKSCFNLHDLCNEIFENISITQNIQVKLIKKFDKDLIISTDEKKLKTILNKIIENSIKFTHQGTIEFGYIIENMQIKFFVIDTGIGILQEDIANIFKPFYKIEHNSKLYKGTGLGLATALIYANLIDAKITVDSEFGKGSAFYVTFDFK